MSEIPKTWGRAKRKIAAAFMAEPDRAWTVAELGPIVHGENYDWRLHAEAIAGHAQDVARHLGWMRFRKIRNFYIRIRPESIGEKSLAQG